MFLITTLTLLTLAGDRSPKQPQSVDRTITTRFFDDSPVGGGSCHGKNVCLVIFVAPWCSACKSFIASASATIVQTATSQWNDVGIQYVVGRAPSESTAPYAATLAPLATVDTDTTLFHAFGIQSFPRMAVLNRAGDFRVLEQELDVLSSDPQSVPGFLHDVLDR